MADLYNENEELEIITLTDEEGNEEAYEFIDIFEYEEKEYAVLLPVEDDDSGEAVILLVEPIDDETEAYSSVEDVKVLEAVFELFKERYKEEFNFVD